MNTILKIVIIGGESTGKSTLCDQLARHYNTVWVREYAREYLEARDGKYEESDLIEMAKGQVLHEEEAMHKANKILFCDTDLQVIRVWSEYAYGRCHPIILNMIASHSYDAYILTSPDFPWQPDPLREHPEPHLRDYFYRQYLECVSSSGLPFCVVEGNEEERLQKAIQFTDRLLIK